MRGLRPAIGALGLGIGAAVLLAGIALADLPTADSQPGLTTDHGVVKQITLTGTAAAGSADFTVDSGPSHGNLSATTGTMTCDLATPANCSSDPIDYTPDAAYEGSDSFSFNVHNPTDGASLDATVTIEVGSAPVANDDPDVSCNTDPPVQGTDYTTLEDTPLTVLAASPCGLLANDTDADAGDTLTAALHTDGSHGAAVVGQAGGFTYTPTADANGDDTFTYDANDGATTSTATVHVHVIAVNDAPSYTPGGAVTVNEDSGAYSAAWASSPSGGPADESGQTLDYQLTTDSNAGLFSVVPALAANGTLTFTPAADANGSATIGFKLHDDGGTANGGVDLSAEHTFSLTVNAVNDAPSFTAGTDPTVSEDSGAFSATSWATSPSPGPADESGQTVTYQVTSDDNAALFSSLPAVSASGTLTFTPGANRNGVAHLQIVAKDSGGTSPGTDTSAPASVTITVNPVNDPPNAVNDTTFVVPENSHGTLLNVLANDTSLPDAPELLTVTAVTQGAHGSVTIAADKLSVTYTPTSLYYGSDFFTYTISDPGLLTDTATVLLTITKDVAAPTVIYPHQAIRTVTSATTVVTMTSTTLPGRLTWAGSDAGVGISTYQLQRSTNGGAYASLTLSSPTSTALNVNLTFGTTYRFRVRAIDRNGNASAWVYGPTFAVNRAQESSTAVKYGGTWAVTYNVNDSGGAARYASVAGRYASFSRTFRDVAIVAPRSSTRGTAYVYLDGVKVATISLKTSVTSYRQVVWTAHFASIGGHTVKIVVVGTGRIDLDCFVVLN
jgi:VCBS repeat-containing protein